MKRIYTSGSVALTSLLLFTFLILPVSYRNTASLISLISGRIIEVQPNQIVIQTESGRQSIFLPSEIKITKNTFNAQLSDLKPNDQVTVKLEDNQPKEIITTSAIISDWGRWLPSLIIALLTFILLTQLISLRLRRASTNSGLVTAHTISRLPRKEDH